MNRHPTVKQIGRALLSSVVVLLAGNGRSYAQRSDIDPVKAAVETYHAAIGSLHMPKMEPLWAYDAYPMAAGVPHRLAGTSIGRS